MTKITKVFLIRLLAAIVGIAALLFIAESASAEEEQNIADIIAELDFSHNYIHYLTDEQNKLLRSEQCEQHEPTDPDEVTIMNQAYTLFWCAAYVRLADSNYKRGWELYKMGSTHLSQIPCNCPLHNHADQMSYGTYLEVKGALDNNGNITDTIVNYCANVTTDYDPVVPPEQG